MAASLCEILPGKQHRTFPLLRCDVPFFIHPTSGAICNDVPIPGGHLPQSFGVDWD